MVLQWNGQFDNVNCWELVDLISGMHLIRVPVNTLEKIHIHLLPCPRRHACILVLLREDAAKVWNVPPPKYMRYVEHFAFRKFFNMDYLNEYEYGGGQTFSENLIPFKSMFLKTFERTSPSDWLVQRQERFVVTAARANYARSDLDYSFASAFNSAADS